MVYGCPLKTTVKLLADEQLNSQAVRIQYRGKENFKSQAKILGIMDDFKASRLNLRTALLIKLKN